MAILRHYIIIGNKKYEYILKPANKKTLLVCEDAGIEERFPNEEIPIVLSQLPKIIISIQRKDRQQSEVLRFRVTPEEKMKIIEQAYKSGFDNISSYIRDKLLKD